MLRLVAGDYALTLAPERGGAVLGFDWRGRSLMQPIGGPDALDAPASPLAPFSLGLDEPTRCPGPRQTWLGSNPLDAIDGLTEWVVTAATPSSAALVESAGGAAPHVISQSFTLNEDGLTVSLSLVNLGRGALPARLGVRTLLPRGSPAIAPCTRPLAMHWPEHALTLMLEPSDNLAITRLTAPGQGIACCAEPALLPPGGVATATLRLRATVDGACAAAPTR